MALHCPATLDRHPRNGGLGSINEYRIAQLYKNARVQRIYGGANEVMKVLIARSL